MEILDQTTPQGRFLYKKYQKYNKQYEFLRKKAFDAYKKDDPFFVFKYTETQTSFTKDLSDDMMYHFPDKIIVLAREKSGYYVMSIRSSDQAPEVRPAFVKAIALVEGSGGGHAHACGAKIVKEDFKTFITTMRQELSL